MTQEIRELRSELNRVSRVLDVEREKQNFQANVQDIWMKIRVNFNMYCTQNLGWYWHLRTFQWKYKTWIFPTNLIVNLNFHIQMNPGLSPYSRLKINSHFTICISFINVYSKKCILIQRYTLHSHDRLFQEIWQMGFTIFPHSPKKVLKYRVSQIEMCWLKWHFNMRHPVTSQNWWGI